MLIPFDYIKFNNLKEASKFLEEHGDETYMLAGGTDILIKIRARKVKPKYLLDLKGIEELKGIKRQENKVIIGSLTLVNELIENEYINKYFPLLRDGASYLGDYEIRNRATIGGNICNASPSADTVIPLLTYEAKVTISKGDIERIEELDKFFKGPGKVNLKRGEILKNIILELSGSSQKGKFFRISRVDGMDLASLNMAILVENPEDIMKRKVKIAIGAVAPVPLRVYELEEFLRGKIFNNDTFEEAKKILLSNLNPREGSLRASPTYKKRMALNYLSWLFKEA